MGKETVLIEVTHGHKFRPTQVSSVKKLKVGETYIDRHDINPSYAGGKFTVTKAPYKNGQDQWLVEGELEAPYFDGKVKVTWPLDHHGVIPYPDGTWNNASWMEDPKKVKPVEEK